MILPRTTLSNTRDFPRDTHISVDPNRPPGFPEDDKCDKEYFADKLNCEAECKSSSLSEASCRVKAWWKWAKCKNNGEPDRPDHYDSGLPDGWWMS